MNIISLGAYVAARGDAKNVFLPFPNAIFQSAAEQLLSVYCRQRCPTAVIIHE